MSYVKIKKHILYTVSCLLVYFAAPSQAQCQAKSLSLAFSGGYLSHMRFGKLEPLPNTADIPSIIVSLENEGPSFGLALGYLIKDRIELQGLFHFSRSEIIYDLGIGLAGVPLGKTIVSDTKNFSYGGNVLYYFSLTRISPFVTFGLGAVTLNPEEFRTRTKLCLNFGAGIRFIIFQHFSLSLEIKDYIHFFNYPQDFEMFFPAIYSLDFNRSQHRLGIHVSLSYSLL